MHIFHYIEKHGTTGTAFLELCRNRGQDSGLIPEGYELLLPRFRVASFQVTDYGKPRNGYEWIAQCWWRSVDKGTLDYCLVLDLPAAQIQEFRQLPGNLTVPGMEISHREMSYLDQVAAVWQPVPTSGEEVDNLDPLWQTLVPKQLKEYALRKPAEQTINSYLLPVEALACWNWESLRDLILKREETTVEEILDYIEYKRSGSDKRYISPKDRELAKQNGLKFWRDGDDL